MYNVVVIKTIKQEKCSYAYQCSCILLSAKKDELLTSEDKELLHRWTKMQTVNIPIAPRPRSDSQSRDNLGSDSGVTGSHDQAKNSASQGQGHSDNDGGQGHVSYNTSLRNVQQGTLDLLQQRILGNSAKQEVEVSGEKPQQTNVGMTQNTMMAHSDNQTLPNTSQTNVSSPCQQQTNLPVPQMENTSMNKADEDIDYSVDFSNVQLGDIDFLSMVNSPEMANILTQDIVDEINSHNMPATTQPQYTGNSNLQYTGMSQMPAQPTLDSPQDFLQKLCSQTSPSALVDNRRSSGNFVPHDNLCDTSGNQLSVSPDFKKRLSPSHYTQGHASNLQPGVSANQRVSPQFFNQSGGQNVVTPSQQVQPGNQSQIFNFDNQSNLLPQVGQSQMGASGGQGLPFQDVGLRMNSRNPPDPSMLFLSSQETQNQSVGNQQQINYRNQSRALRQEVGDPYHSSSNSNSPPTLSVNTQQPQQSFRHFFQNPMPGPSHGSQLDVSYCLCSIIKQAG